MIGSSGLLSGEFMRLLEEHPGLHLGSAISRQAGVPLRSLQPHLSSEGVTTEFSAWLEAREARGTESPGPEVLVLGLPHGHAAGLWSEVRGRLGDAADELIVVDLSADFRLRDPELYAGAYGAAHPTPDELPRWEYGLVEWNRDSIAQAKRVAAPGCFATALQLAVLPAAQAGWLSDREPWVLCAVTGSSGSGNEPKATTHHPHRSGNFVAYGVEGHRHEAELHQSIAPFGLDPSVSFVPHSGPFVRGIHLTAHLPLVDSALEDSDVLALYSKAYGDEPFIEVLGSSLPNLRRVVGSNRVAIHGHVRHGMLRVLLTLDNVIKGGAGQALQALNGMLGYPETWGLPRAGLGVIG